MLFVVLLRFYQLLLRANTTSLLSEQWSQLRQKPSKEEREFFKKVYCNLKSESFLLTIIKCGTIFIYRVISSSSWSAFWQNCLSLFVYFETESVHQKAQNHFDIPLEYIRSFASTALCTGWTTSPATKSAD